MKAFLFFSLFVMSYDTAVCQQIGFSGGYCNNHFYDFHKDEGHLRTNYNEGPGYSFNINFDNFYQDTFLFRYSLNFTKYSGKIMTTNGGLGAGSTTTAYVEKYSLGLSVFPININIFKELRFSFGGDFSYLINSDVSGTQSSWNIISGEKDIVLDDGSVDIFKKYNLGIISRIGYHFKIYKRWFMVPEYNFYLGLTNEFNNIESKVYSYRHCLMLGFINRFK